MDVLLLTANVMEVEMEELGRIVNGSDKEVFNYRPAPIIQHLVQVCDF